MDPLKKEILALDPGNVETAYVVYDLENSLPLMKGKIPNEEIFPVISLWNLPLVCEFPYPRGQLGSWQLFETIEVIGRFRQYAKDLDLDFTKMNRQDVKTNICPGVQHPKDGQIRQSIIDRFGGESACEGGKCPTCKGKGTDGFNLVSGTCPLCNGIGTIPGAAKPKKCPKCKGTTTFSTKQPRTCEACHGTSKMDAGVLYGFSNDTWQALGVALTYQDRGPSKSSAVLQEESKAKKEIKKQKTLERLQKLNAPTS